MPTITDWHGCYEGGWKDAIVPEAFAHLSTRGASSASPQVRPSFNGTRPRAKPLLVRCVGKEFLAAPIARFGDSPDQPRSIPCWPDFVGETGGEPRQAQLADTLNRRCRDADERVRPGAVGLGFEAEHFGQVASKAVVLGGRELLGIDGDACPVPRSIVANQAGERDGMREGVQQSPADELRSVSIERRGQVGEAWNRNRVESSARPRLAIALVEILAPLNRARGWREPSVLRVQPLALLDGVVAGQVKVSPRRRDAERRISEQRPNGNVPLKLCQPNV